MHAFGYCFRLNFFGGQKSRYEIDPVEGAAEAAPRYTLSATRTASVIRACAISIVRPGARTFSVDTVAHKPDKHVHREPIGEQQPLGAATQPGSASNRSAPELVRVEPYSASTAAAANGSESEASFSQSRFTCLLLKLTRCREWAKTFRISLISKRA